MKVEKVCHPEYVIFAFNIFQVTDAL